jgi:hypothetical protein
MIQRLFLDGVAGQRCDKTVGEGMKGAAEILPRAAPSSLTFRDHATPFTRKAADGVLDRLLQNRRLDELTTHNTILPSSAVSARKEPRVNNTSRGGLRI